MKTVTSYDEEYFKIKQPQLLELENYVGQPWYTEAVSEVKKSKNGLVLDTGCGAGKAMKLLNGCEIYGIDISRSVAEIATQFGSVVLTEASNLPFRDTIFSSVLMIEVIEHMKDKDSTKALKEAHRVLRKNGQLTIHTQPNGFLGRPFYFLNRRRLRETGRINTLTPWELKKRILRCNFSIEKFYMRDFLILRRLERSFFGNMLKQFLGNRMLAVTRRGVQKEHSKPVVGYF